MLGVLATTRACSWAGEPSTPKAAPSAASGQIARDVPRDSAPPRSRGEPAPTANTGASAELSPWASKDACLRAVQANRGERGNARVGTWNVRWYPDGGPGKKAATPGTDVAWLACAIALLDVDVLAVQEFKTLPRARAHTEELTRELARLTGGRWKAEFDSCPNEATQHVGLLWNEARAKASDQRTYGELNPHGEPCKDSLRPGFGAHFRFANGGSAYVVSVHFKSGTERRSHELRRASFQALEAVRRRASSVAPHAPLVVAGDFNTMGCSRCSPSISAEEERGSFGALLEQADLAWVPSDLGCTGYYRRRGTLLDGFALSKGRASSGPAQVSGYCQALSCAKDSGAQAPSAREALSDHCPVVLELSSG